MSYSPLLSEDGEKEALSLIEGFKKRLVAAADEAIGDLYSDIMPHIESDSWSNFRGRVVSELSNYDDEYGAHKYKSIRQKILDEHREDLIKELNKDLIDEVESLKSQLKFERARAY